MHRTPCDDVAQGPTAGPATIDQIDLREQLFNTQAIGPIQQVQLPAEAITSLHGILFDIDPGSFREEVAPPDVRSSPVQFYERVVRPWLDRHPALADAEVRVSGRGLHVIPGLDAPVAFTTDGDRRRWAGVVRAIQAALPTDPHAPGITAVTRPVGSINGKTKTPVHRQVAGKPGPAGRILDLFDQLQHRPFRTVAGILFGPDRVRPCPVCRKEGSGLVALDRAGKCYGCGTVPLARLYEVFLAPRPAAASE